MPPGHREWLTVLLRVAPGALAAEDVDTVVLGKVEPEVGVALSENPGGGGGGGRPEVALLLPAIDPVTRSEDEDMNNVLI